MDAAPEVVIHAGAYTDVDGAERNPALAMAVNAEGTARVARAAAKTGARLIYISTDYVFDGLGTRPYLETDPTNPISVYGESKRAGEQRALDGCDNTLVVRTAWLYGRHGKNFVKTMLQLAIERPCLRIVADQRGCPTFSEDLAGMIGNLVAHPVQGVLHVTNRATAPGMNLPRKLSDCPGFKFPSSRSRRQICPGRRNDPPILSCREPSPSTRASACQLGRMGCSDS